LNDVDDKIPLDLVRSAITAELARFASDGPTEDEVRRARNNLESDQLGSLENLSDLSFLLNEIQQYYGGVEHFADWSTRYRNVTADGIRKAVGKWLLTPNFLTIRFTPITARRGDAPEPDRAIPPPFLPEKPFRIPEIQSAKLPNGLQIFVVERHNLPKVAVQLRFNGSFADSPPGKPGVAMMTMLTLACATPTRTADQINKEVVDLAGSLDSRADAGTQYIGFNVLKRNFNPMFALMSDMLLHSLYPEDIFVDRKSGVIANYVYNQGSIDGFAPWLGEVAFGPAHPLGAIAANPEKLRGITAADVQEFQRRHWHPGAAVLVFAGDITLDEAVAAATAGLGGWAGTAEPRAKYPPPAPMKGRTFLLERQGVDQTRIIMILPGIARDNPDYAAMLLANHVLGVGFFSRLYRSIRLDRGIAYDVDSTLDAVSGNGLWVANSAVQADKTREALGVFTQELRGFAGEKPITQTELDAAKQIEIRSWPQNFESNSSTVDAIAAAWTRDESLNELRTFEQRIAAVTLDQVNAAVRKYAQPDKTVFLLVGDPAKIGAIDGLVTLK
jgi:zinc protease